MMDKSSRSPSVSSDLDDLETSSCKSNDATARTSSITTNSTNNVAESNVVTRNEFTRNETKEPEISQLVDNMKRLESTINSLRQSTASQITHLEEMLNQKNKIITDLEEKLDQQRDYDDIKRELTYVRGELSHFGPVSGLEPPAADPKALESYLLEKSKALQQQAESLKLGSSSESGNLAQQQMLQRQAFFNPFTLPQLQGLGNVESFGTLLGEEIANSYAKVMAKRDPTFLAMAAAAAVNSNNCSSGKLIPSSLSSGGLAGNHSGNNLTDSLHSPSQVSNGDDAIEDKSSGSVSASTTPTSAMIGADGADALNRSPLGATTVPDLALNVRNYSPASRNPSANASYDRLQQQLRCNVEKYMNETLNTLQISRCVRELLSMHNIGQRLFAKYVLGLSQGTVSELLSKPKPWDKLTEKGRDSYRKMHAWATDERCINLLKSMVPRKGKETSFKQDDPVAEERIAQILNEAQRSMKGHVNRSDFFASNFINGDHAQLQLSHSKLDRDNKREPHDNASENGSERDDKSEAMASADRKSPASTLNATALATINNFYRNFNDSPSFNDRQRPLSKPPKLDGDELMHSPDLMRLYQDQLAKLIGQHIEEGFRNSQNHDDVRSAINFYNQELSRANPLLSSQTANPELFARLFSTGLFNGTGYLGGLPLSVDSLQQANSLESMRKISPSLETPPSRETRDLPIGNTLDSRVKLDSMLGQIKAEPGSPQHNNGALGTSNGTNNSNNIGANSSVLSGDLNGPEDLAASPLQRMQSITNSLLSQSSLPSLPTQSSRPAKAVLPPITQQQFDQYNNLNTEDIVKRVKEQLSQYSISQRLFGESVLGLSQGSVSDLLARPKPWHMLTQKGREPFIRMKMFLEDENAIHKLVASQYKIAPEKLMRTGSFVPGTGMPSSLSLTSSVVAQIPTPPSSLPPLNITPPISKSSPHLKQNSISTESAMKYEQSLSPSSVEYSARSNASTPEPGMTTPTLTVSPLNVRQRVTPFTPTLNNNLLRPSVTPASSYMQPSVYELAALTSDLDTQIITTRIKETLMAHNIGQKIFGEVVLGLSQGSVSELLSKPKPWHMLSIKGREPFIRMQLWLNDPNNIEKLQTLKNERREANKRRRTHIEEGIGFKSLDPQLFNFSNSFGIGGNLLGKTGLGAPAGIYPMAPSSAQPTTKKARILFTEEQKEALRIAFAMDPYPSSTTAEFLAKELNLSIRTITNWFHNHRMRLKQINTTNGEENSQTALPYSIGRDSVSFDQTRFRGMLQSRLADLKLRAATAGSSNNSSNGSSSSSNHYGSFGPNSASSPQHRFKYSPSLFQTQSIYSNNTNSCSSPGSSSPFHEEEEDMGTLDLSMSSHNQQMRHPELSDKLDSTGRSSVQDDSDDGCRSGDEEEIERTHSDNDERKISINKQFVSETSGNSSSRRKPQHVMSSSSRRKAAQPQQWVAPVEPIIYGEDDYVEDDSEEDEAPISNESLTKRPHEGDPIVHADSRKGSKQDEMDADDQKTDEEVDLEPARPGDDSDTDQEIPVAPYKKLKSSTSVMSKIAINDDSSNIMQECVQ